MGVAWGTYARPCLAPGALAPMPGPASHATPANPRASPASTAAGGLRPPGRSQSAIATHTGTVATSSAEAEVTGTTANSPELAAAPDPNLGPSTVDETSEIQSGVVSARASAGSGTQEAIQQ